jgi:hypothetical protein
LRWGGHDGGHGRLEPETGESRLELVARNAAIFQSIIPRVAEVNPDGIILVATNPVDVLTLDRRLRGVVTSSRFPTQYHGGCRYQRQCCAALDWSYGVWEAIC